MADRGGKCGNSDRFPLLGLSFLGSRIEELILRQLVKKFRVPKDKKVIWGS